MCRSSSQYPVSRLVQQRLDELERARRIGQELHFQQALGVFFGALRIVDDARADAHLAAPVAENDRRADRDVEQRPAVRARCVRWRRNRRRAARSRIRG